MTRRTKLLGGVFIVAAGAAGLLLLLRERKSPREQIVEAIMALADGAEAKDVTACIHLVSPDYRDSQGNTRVILRKLASEGFRGAQSIDVVAYEPTVTVSGQEATVVVEAQVVAVTSTGRHDWPLEVTLTFKRERRRWRIVRSEGWQQIEPEW